MATTPKTALITGAGSGIGKGIAEALDALGMRLALLGRDASKLEAVVAGLRQSGGPALALSCDVADRGQVKTAVDATLEAFGTVDVLVCNAGINVRNRAIDTIDPADFDAMVATILTGSFNLVHFVLPGMIAAGGGLIVQIDSVSGKRASPLGGAGYSAAKFGQAALGVCLGREQGKNGVRSSVVYPGEVNTPILDKRPVPVGPERRAAILQPEDVAAAVKFLVELHPRVHVPELVIKPTVDDFG